MGFLSGSQNKWERPAFNDHNLGDSDDYDVELARPQHVRSPKIHRSMEAVICERLDTPAIQVPPRAPEIVRLSTPELEPLSPLYPSFCACCPNPEGPKSTRSQKDKMDNQCELPTNFLRLGYLTDVQ